MVLAPTYPAWLASGAHDHPSIISRIRSRAVLCCVAALSLVLSELDAMKIISENYDS